MRGTLDLVINFFLVLTFLAGFLLVAGINLLLLDLAQERKQLLKTKLEDERRLSQLERARSSMAATSVFSSAYSAIDGGEGLALYHRWRIYVAQTGKPLNPLFVLLSSPGLSLVLGTLTFLLTQSLILTALVAVVASAVPFLVVSKLRTSRRNQLLKQLPEAYEMLARVLRSGQTMTQAIRGVADEFSPPIADEFGFCWEQQNLGLSPEASFQELAKRTDILEIKILVVALSVHRTTGGNLAALLLKLSKIIRERERIRGKLETLTAEGRFQAYLLTALPFVLAGIIGLINPGYLAPLFEYPIVFVIAAGMLILGYVWIQHIINVEK